MTEQSITTESTVASAFGESIRSAVGSVPYGYSDKLESAIGAAEKTHESLVTEANYDLFDKLVEAAEAKGYGSYAKAILAEAGLTERPAPEPEPEVVTAEADGAEKSDREVLDGLVSTLAELAGTVNSLTSFARSNGYRG